MKLTLNLLPEINETEVIINCTNLDSRMIKLMDYIRQYAMTLECRLDNSIYYLGVDSILYIESVDKKTFVYDPFRVFSSRYSLSELEVMLENTLFCRVSKKAILNVAYISSVIPAENHRLEAVLTNGEHIIVTRNYKEKLYDCMKSRSMELAERSVYNAGKVVSFMTVPKRVIAMSYEQAEILASLGVEKNIAAIAPAECDRSCIRREYAKQLEGIPEIRSNDTGVPKPRELKMFNADFVLGSYHSIKTMELKSGKAFKEYNINFYAQEATIPETATLEGLYKDILNLGKIFHVEAKSIELVERLRSRVSAISAEGAINRKHTRVFVFDSNAEKPFTAMKGTIESYLIRRAGGRNIFEDREGTYQSVTWKEVADKDPQVMLVHDYKDYMTAKEKIEVLKRQKELEGVSAIMNNQIYVIGLADVFPGIRVADTLATFVKWMK